MAVASFNENGMAESFIHWREFQAIGRNFFRRWPQNRTQIVTGSGLPVFSICSHLRPSVEDSAPIKAEAPS
jgi:hypothetical protein